jgi:sugar phosphate permease
MASTAIAAAETISASRYRYVVTFYMLLAVIVAYLDRLNISVLIADKAFVTDMGIANDPVRQGMLMTGFLMVYGVANVFLSPLGDVMGPRKALSLSLALWAICMCVGGLVGSFALMLAMRLVLGVSEGPQMAMSSKYVKNWFPSAERGRANSIWQLGLKLAPGLGMPFFAWLIVMRGWRFSFFVMSAATAVPLILFWFFTTDHPNQCRFVNQKERDHIQAGSKENSEGRAVTVKEGVKYFVKDYRYWLLVIYYTCHCSVMWGIMTWLPSYLKKARGFSWAGMGTWVAFSYVFAICLVLLTGYISDRIGRRAPFNVLAMAVVAVGLYISISVHSNTWAALAICIANGALGLGIVTVWTLMQQLVPTQAVAAGAGVMNGISNGIAGLAPAIIGYFVGLTGGFAGGFMYVIGSALVGLLCTLILALQRY